ncbi:TadE/TadG family type IV pilus assembly protein [Erythrobacter sp. SG61-1L]|uniref:TadE/TadG family type IV pilus assembly protein n=1 Tax=Erythrobacter sp. SG61-1L TaxID=1603897 RepID=UPI0019D6BC5B|nr:TadE/TadG family type IV pilus assembly protein [Erythrobacter sp. SG61-1L]
MLARDRQGATLPEFAIVLPTFLVLLFGIYDLGQGIYLKSVLQGAILDAGRDAGLESGLSQKDAIDQYVRDQLSPIAISNPTYEVERLNYSGFNDVGRPEDFTDSNNNDKYDAGECFVDENGNNTWDGDVGKGGLGGANDVVVYSVTVNYDRVFPLWKLISGEQRGSVSATTALRNQPFGPQAARAKKQVCPGT